MSRPIEFRVWGVDINGEGQSKMYFSDDIRDTDMSRYWFARAEDEDLNELNPWMQFTGLLDKNGVKIFEGDFLNHSDRTYLVKWDEYMAAFQVENIKDQVDADFFNWGNVPSLRTKDVPTFSLHEDPNCEVIGNIYEIPNLLEDK